MNRKVMAGIVAGMVITAGIVTTLVLMNFWQDEPLLTTDASPYSGGVVLYEVRPNTTVSEEYFEIHTNETCPDIEGWHLTTYDGDYFRLPKLLVNGTSLYIRVYTGKGDSELNGSDHQVTIFMNRSARVLNPAGDEVGLHDQEGRVIDFMRYGGGNGDEVRGKWPLTDNGPGSPASNLSLSLIGTFGDEANGSHWMASPPTPGEPNVVFLEPELDGVTELFWMRNGLRLPELYNGIADAFRDPKPATQISEEAARQMVDEWLKETEDLPDRPPEGDDMAHGPPDEQGKPDKVVILGAEGVSNDELKLIKKYIEESLQYYREQGYGNPKTTTAGVIKITVKFGSKPYSTGSCGEDGSIIINLGTDWRDETLKCTGEHELFHAFQFNNLTDEDGDPYHRNDPNDTGFSEGMAEYWGVMSALKKFGISVAKFMNISQNITGLNWHWHYASLNSCSPFGFEWGGTWNDYMANFLLVKFIAENFSRDKLLEINNKIRYYGHMHPKNCDSKCAMEQVLGLTWKQIYEKFLLWLLHDAKSQNGVPTPVTDVKLEYKGQTTGDKAKIRGWGGATIQEVKVSNNTAFKISVSYGGENSQYSDMVVKVIVFYEDGTNETRDLPMDKTKKAGSLQVNPLKPKKIAKVWVVKAVYKGPTVDVNMTVTPAETSINYRPPHHQNTTCVGVESTEVAEFQVLLDVMEALSPFGVFFSFEGSDLWDLIVTRWWDNGTVDNTEVVILEGTSIGYHVDPDPAGYGPEKLEVIGFELINKNTTSANATMGVGPWSYWADPSHLLNPMTLGIQYNHTPIQELDHTEYGGFISGYAYLETPANFYEFELTLQGAFEYEFYEYDSNFNEHDNHLFNGDHTYILQMAHPNYTTQVYYFVLKPRQPTSGQVARYELTTT